MGVDVMPKVLYAGTEASIKFFRRGVVSNQDTDIHPFHDFLGAEALEVLADGSVGLSEFIRFVQHFFVEGKEGFIREENCGFINPVDGGQELSEVEVLDGHGIEIAAGLYHKD